MFSLQKTCVLALAAVATASSVAVSNVNLEKRQGAPGNGVLTDFQVYEPVLTPSGTSNQYGCIYTQTLMAHDFANSYGAPFVGM
jgi:hypothetical protein